MNLKKLVVDRITNGIAVCENEDLSRTEIGLELLPQGVKEGSVLFVDDNGTYTLDTDTEKLRREEMLKKQRSVFG